MLRIMHNAPAIASAFCTTLPVSAFFMSDSAERLKEAREKSGYTSAKSAAEAMGIALATYIQHENGTRGYPASKAQRYAKFFRTSPEWLLYGKQVTPATLGPHLFVKGKVAAGVFQDAIQWPEEDWQSFTGRADVEAPLAMRFGLRVDGPSMNLIYPDGTILDCVRYFDDAPISNGKRVIVERHHINGSVEATVKEYLKDADGVEWLVPRSNNPAFQMPLRCDEPGGSIEKIEITAIVVAAIIQE